MWGAMIPAPHRSFLDAALPALQADPRVLGVGVGGSWLSASLDIYSDLDLIIACEPAAHAAMLDEAPAIATRLGPLLSVFRGDHVHEPRLFICLYEPELLHVDLKFVALGDLATRVEDPVVLWERDGAMRAAMAAAEAVFPVPDPQWIEDRFWTWVHYAATKLGRGELFEVIDFLAAVRAMVLGPLLCRRHGQLPRGVRRLESIAADETAALRATIATHSFAACAAAIQATVSLYRELRGRRDDSTLQRRETVERAACAYLDRVCATPPG